MYGIGLIGAGDIVNKAYLPILSNRTDCKVIGICSKFGKSANRLAREYRIEHVFTDYKELIQIKDIDTVLLCTPNNLHYKIANYALVNKKHVLVEKPLCSQYRDSFDLINKAKEYDKIFYAAFNNNFREENQWLKSKVLSGEIGDLEILDFEWYRTMRYIPKSWIYDYEQSGGGVLIDLGSHLIYYTLSLIPNRKKYIAYCSNYSHENNSWGVEDTSISMITIDGAVSIVIKLGWDMNIPSPSKVNLRVFGKKGSISNKDFQGEKSDGYANMIQDFFNHVEAKTMPDLGSVGDTMMLLDALYKSSQSQSLITGMFSSTKPNTKINIQR